MSIQQVISIGVDPHADTISVAGVDAAGMVIFEATVANRRGAVDELINRVGTRGVRWAIEGSGGLGRLLADRLLIAGADVYEVPTRLTARLRLRNGYAKTDRLDASAIARFTISEPLPKVDRHPIVEALRVLTRQREKPSSGPRPKPSTGSGPGCGNSTQMAPLTSSAYEADITSRPLAASPAPTTTIPTPGHW